MNSINRFWNGDVSLPKSYWLIGWLLAFPIIVGSFTIMDYHFYFGAALLVIWIGFSTVGIWRSSDKYEGKKAWAVFTKIWLILNIIHAIFMTVVMHVVNARGLDVIPFGTLLMRPIGFIYVLLFY